MMDRDPSMRATLKVQSKNNIIEAGLRERVRRMRRECQASLSLIDHERLDTRDFLKQLRQCSTDDLPEAKHWLGNRTPSGNRVPRTTRLTFRNQSAPTTAEQQEQARQAELQHVERAAEYSMLGFRSLRPKPELVQRTMALHKLFSRRNLYAGMGYAGDAWGATKPNKSEEDCDLDSVTLTSLNDPSETLDSYAITDVRSPEELHTSRPEARNSQSSSNNEKNSKAAPHHNQNLHGSNGKSPSKLHSLQDESHRRSPHDCGRPDCRGCQPQADDGGGNGSSFMKQLLGRKSGKWRRRKEPLQDRINDFFDRMHVIREEERRLAAMPSHVEMQRRWVALRHGRKVALVQSSEEEEEEEEKVVVEEEAVLEAAHKGLHTA